MNKIVNAVRREPVRAYLYSVSTVIIGLAVTYGVITDSAAPLWISLVGALTAVGTTENIRYTVSPVGKMMSYMDAAEALTYIDDIQKGSPDAGSVRMIRMALNKHSARYDDSKAAELSRQASRMLAKYENELLKKGSSE